MSPTGRPTEIDPMEKATKVKKICTGLQSQDRKVRKQTYGELKKFICDENVTFTDQELRNIFNETHMYVLNGLRDKNELVREEAVHFIKFLITDKLEINDFYLTYIFPVIIERIGCLEVIEESEEIRLQLLMLLEAIIDKYSLKVQLKPFLNDSVTILAETVKDKYPAIKELSCKTIVKLAIALPNDFHMQAEVLIKPVLTSFSHQRYKVRVEAIKATGEIVMHSSYKGLDEVVGPLAERLFDQIPIVRQTVARVAARWLLDYRDRYSFFHKILPLLLTGLNDEVEETRKEAEALWEKVGLQYQQENEKDLKNELDYLTAPPEHYPFGLIRPNLGCRTLVKRNIIKIAGAICRELRSWQSDIRVRCGQLLCAVALHAEDGITQNLQELLPAMYSAAQDDDSRVVDNVLRAAQLIGAFVDYRTWSKLLLPLIEDEEPYYGRLAVLAALISGAPKQLFSEHVEEISGILGLQRICSSRKKKYQLEMKQCVKELLSKYEPKNGALDSTGANLFVIIVTLVSLRHIDIESEIDVSLLNELASVLGLNDSADLWSQYTEVILRRIDSNAGMWTTVTEEHCIFLTVLANCGKAFCKNLQAIGNILVECLGTEADAEMRLKTFFVLAGIFEKKEQVFVGNFGEIGLSEFLEKLVTDVFVPSLVWHAGVTAEGIRAMAATCLYHTLAPVEGVVLFSSGEVLRPIVDKLTPLLVSLLEDALYHSRLVATDCLVALKENCCAEKVWQTDDLIKIYPEIMRRFDDPTEKVQSNALKKMALFLNDVPEDFKNAQYKAHHELIVDTLLTHFDDDDDNIQAMVFDNLKAMASINKTEVMKKIEASKSILRNQKGCEDLQKYIESSL